MKVLALLLMLYFGAANITVEHLVQSTGFLSSSSTFVVSARNDDQQGKVRATVARLFGKDVEPASDHKPYFLTGDFNGDGHVDLAVLVRVTVTGASLPKEVRSFNPWGYDKTSPSPLALAVVHGSATGWDTGTPLGRFLLGDKEFFATPSWTATTDTPLSLKKKRTARGRRNNVPRMAKGDALALGTEAGIDILLYWDGKTYRIFEPNEEP